MQYASQGGVRYAQLACDVDGQVSSRSTPDFEAVPQHLHPGFPQGQETSGERAWEIFPDDLLMESLLGEGQFGMVHKGRWNGAPVAIKVCATPAYLNSRPQAPKCSYYDPLRWRKFPSSPHLGSGCVSKAVPCH